MDALSPAEARRIAIGTQGLASRDRSARPADVEATILRLGCVQIDSVTAVARAHRLTLASRVGRIPAGTLNGLRHSGRIAEVWAHEACLIAADDLPWFRAAMLSETAHRWYGDVLRRNRRLARDVLRRVEQDGPIVAADLGGAGRPGWWEWSEAKQVLEALFSSGRLAVRERRGFTRVYDLPERLYTAVQLEPVRDPGAVLRWKLERAVSARGIVGAERVHDYFRISGGARAVRTAADDLVEEGRVERVRVGERVCLLDPAARAHAERRPRVAALLSPFDNLLWDREEADRLFGFRHALEIYTPRARRRWGYYVLPLVVGDRISGRVDMAADRRAGLLRALAVHWEGRPAPAALERAHRRLARTLGLDPA